MPIFLTTSFVRSTVNNCQVTKVQKKCVILHNYDRWMHRFDTRVVLMQLYIPCRNTCMRTARIRYLNSLCNKNNNKVYLLLIHFGSALNAQLTLILCLYVHNIIYLLVFEENFSDGIRTLATII